MLLFWALFDAAVLGNLILLALALRYGHRLKVCFHIAISMTVFLLLLVLSQLACLLMLAREEPIGLILAVPVAVPAMILLVELIVLIWIYHRGVRR